MSKDPSLELLLQAANHDHVVDESWLDDIIQRELLDVSATLPDWNNTSCMLQDVGNFLARTTTILSRLADRVVNGDELHEYAEGRIKEMEEEHDFSELDSLIYMQEKHKSLKMISSTLVNTAESLNSVWRTSKMNQFKSRRGRQLSGGSDMTIKSNTPSMVGSPTVDISSMYQNSTSDMELNVTPTDGALVSTTIHSMVPGLPILGSPTHHHLDIQQHPSHSSQVLPPSTPISHDHRPEAAVHEILKTLTTRGTGQYFCPFRMQCTKGGVRDNVLVIFERNSAFRAHLQKHEKMFRCDMPGCNARGGFARIDQLRRHQQTVPHNKCG